MPSTSPSFFPLAANSLANSTPMNLPCLPLTGPTNLTVPYMSPGTLTMSPKATGESAIVVVDAGDRGVFPVKAFKEASRCARAFVCIGELDGRTRCRGVDMLSKTKRDKTRKYKQFSYRQDPSCKTRCKTKTKTRQASSVLDYPCNQPHGTCGCPIISSHLILFHHSQKGPANLSL